MATYINYGEGDEDATVQGAEWLQIIIQEQQGPEAEKAFYEKFRTLHSEQENSRQYNYGPVLDLFVDESADLFAAIPEPGERVKEVESFFALVLSMLEMLDDEQHLDRSTTRLCELFSSSADQQPELRLRLLMMLYNTFNNPDFPVRYRVFKSIIDYSAKAGLFDQVLPYLEYLDSWMVDWDPYLTIEDKRTLFRDISSYMRALNKRVDAFQHLKRYHQLFQGEAPGAVSSEPVMEATIELIKDAVQLPSVIQFDDILAFDTVKALGETKQADLVKLCTTFLSGTVNDLRNFHKQHAKLFDEHGLSLQDAMSKIRLLTLATLAHGRQELELAEVAVALEESEDKVEPWVVRAISEGFIDGRIDQLNHKVLVKSAFQRKFEREEWAFLDAKLTHWIDNLESVIKFIGDQKVLRESVTAAAS
uniref:Eukaryotic translation initiation factor 3 subunit M n=1 Tax=Pyrodinium bahamense TaxID=73915 RepID=A0A7S0A8Y8_9DINO|mmetsp:Transcript_27676/g.76154  ORF Transcript_27676/g.76154 Transcript_27676/m.76154 type:complete len:420 (+) Transcript_27676:66-1325(+)